MFLQMDGSSNTMLWVAIQKGCRAILKPEGLIPHGFLSASEIGFRAMAAKSKGGVRSFCPRAHSKDDTHKS